MADPEPGRLGPLPGSVTVSRFPAPRLTVQEAVGRLNAAGQPFRFFIEAGTGRGSVVYHRYDGYCGLLGGTCGASPRGSRLIRPGMVLTF